jgi:hypothetical protein
MAPFQMATTSAVLGQRRRYAANLTRDPWNRLIRKWQLLQREASKLQTFIH